MNPCTAKTVAYGLVVLVMHDYGRDDSGTNQDDKDDEPHEHVDYSESYADTVSRKAYEGHDAGEDKESTCNHGGYAHVNDDVEVAVTVVVKADWASIVGDVQPDANT